MANQEHVDILRQGVEAWNAWREEHSEVQPNLRNADLSGADLSGADLDSAILSHAILRFARLSHAILRFAILSHADLSFAILNSAILNSSILGFADLSNANLSFTDLSHANLHDVSLSYIDLNHANLSHANLHNANLNHANLSHANLNHAKIGSIIFANIDLRTVKGLETLEHQDPSSIGIDTILKSEGNIPESFLRGAGLDDSFISYVLSLARKPIQYYTCFISYSSKDQAFAERLYADLQSKNVRCWYALEDLKIGDHYHQRIDESIRLYDKLVLILSDHALQSAWVEREVVAAREKEDREKRQVLFPLRLDEAVIETTKAWAADVRRRWHIGDFTRWKEHDEYQKGLNRLLRDLKQEALHDTIESDADKDEKQSTSKETQS